MPGLCHVGVKRESDEAYRDPLLRLFGIRAGFIRRLCLIGSMDSRAAFCSCVRRHSTDWYLTRFIADDGSSSITLLIFRNNLPSPDTLRSRRIILAFVTGWMLLYLFGKLLV